MASDLHKAYFMSVLLMATILLAAALSSGLVTVSGQPKLVKGTWKGKMVGRGTYLKAFFLFSTANLTGTFSGDSSAGAWVGNYAAKYDNEAPENGNGLIRGNYTWRIDSSGALAGEIRAQVTGLFIGELKIPMQGSTSGGGALKGIWNGVFLPNTLNHRNRTPVVTDVKFEVSGDFEGALELPPTPTTPQPPTTTQPPPTTPSPTPSPTPIPTPTPTKPTPPPQPISYQFFIYVAVAAILLGYVYILRVRRARK